MIGEPGFKAFLFSVHLFFMITFMPCAVSIVDALWDPIQETAADVCSIRALYSSSMIPESQLLFMQCTRTNSS